MAQFLSLDELFEGRHFDREIIVLCVRWYLRFKLSFRDLVEMMAERNLSMAHTTIMRWAQQFRASGLHLVIAAIVYWNSTYRAHARAHLRASGELVPAELLPHTSPLSWEHISLSGDFL